MASVDEVYDIVKATGEKVDDLVEWKAGMVEACKSHRRETDDMKETLYGNPSGLKSRVEALTQLKDFWMYILKVLVAAGAVSFVVWILNAMFGGGT